MKQSDGKKIYLYGRLSHEDELQGDSNSIANQRIILEKYAEDNGFTNYEYIYDDGYSGADFDTRPAFLKMIEEVEAGNVSCIVIKDLSRFGRDYLKVGFFTEILFPEKNVRLIAVNDGVDSEKGENDFTPIMNLFNEWFLKNTSRKIRAVWQAKGKSGERLAVIPPYGYRKDPDNPKKLVVDDEAAEVVRRIYKMYVDGMNAQQIAVKLTDEHLLIPSAYKHEKGIVSEPRACKNPRVWNKSTIHKLLDAPEDTGATVNFKTYSKSYKDNKSRVNPQEKQLVFENTHPAIIDAETWEIVRKMRQHKRRLPRYGNPGLFSGIAYCSDCGAKLYHSTREIHNKARTQTRYEGSYSCSEYRKDVQFLNGKRSCSCHYIRENVLTELVLESMRHVLGFAKSQENQFVKKIMDSSLAEQKKAVAASKKTLAKHTQRIEELDKLFERLYEDNVIGKIDDERYEKMSANYMQEQKALKESVKSIETAIAGFEEQSGNVEIFLALVRKYTDIQELNHTIVNEFIDKIIVYEPENKRKDRVQKIEIIFNGIGTVELPQERSEA
jgi:DNA invertase Pin-like site-specific DNA recombinase